MENNRKLGLYVSYYLARFDEQAYLNLGIGNQRETHIKIGELLSVKPATIKNWRDEFDPLFGHRAGWYQRPMTQSRAKVAQALENLDEFQVRSIVSDILNGKINKEPDEVNQLLSLISEDSKGEKKVRFIPRTPTGKAAEEYFQRHYLENHEPVKGNLIDCRDWGVGYDFRIENSLDKYYVEVKGLSEQTGGILFTSKEWSMANEYTIHYFLCIVSNINGKPKITFIRNPAERLSPKKVIYTAIQLNWIVSHNQLSEIND